MHRVFKHTDFNSNVDTFVYCTRTCHGHIRKTRSHGETHIKLYDEISSALASWSHEANHCTCHCVLKYKEFNPTMLVNSKADLARYRSWLLLNVDTIWDCTRTCHGHIRKTRCHSETNNAKSSIRLCWWIRKQISLDTVLVYCWMWTQFETVQEHVTDISARHVATVKRIMQRVQSGYVGEFESRSR